MRQGGDENPLEIVEDSRHRLSPLRVQVSQHFLPFRQLLHGAPLRILYTAPLVS